MNKEKIVNAEPIPEPVIKPINYKAVEYLGWFMSDAQNLRNWSSQMFGSDIDLTSPRLMELKAAAENSLSEIEDDVVKIREFLAEYIPPNK
jgi:hypothetical protein